MSRASVPWVLVALLLVPSVAAAQDPGKVGVFMGYPSLGLVWQISEGVAVRPEISFDHSSTEIDAINDTTVESSATNVGFGASALFYLSDEDRLRTYLSPSFRYSHNSGSGSSSLTLDSSAYRFGGAFGAQFSATDRFSVFGELGIDYTHSTSEISAGGRDAKGNNVGTQTAVGVIFWF